MRVLLQEFVRTMLSAIRAAWRAQRGLLAGECVCGAIICRYGRAVFGVTEGAEPAFYSKHLRNCLGYDRGRFCCLLASEGWHQPGSLP